MSNRKRQWSDNPAAPHLGIPSLDRAWAVATDQEKESFARRHGSEVEARRIVGACLPKSGPRDEQVRQSFNELMATIVSFGKGFDSANPYTASYADLIGNRVTSEVVRLKNLASDGEEAEQPVGVRSSLDRE